MRPEARETAKEAARRAGMSVEDWLDAVISKEAGHIGADPRLPERNGDAASSEAEQGHSVASSHASEQPAGRGPAAYAPRRNRGDSNPKINSDLPPMVQLPPALEHALAEIAARQRKLDGESAPVMASEPVEPTPTEAPQSEEPAEPPPAVASQIEAPAEPPPKAHEFSAPPAPPPEAREVSAPPAPPPVIEPHISEPAAPPPAMHPQASAHTAPERAPEMSAPTPTPPPPPVPAQNLAGLEAQLRNITYQIETLRQPGVSEAINALRVELTEIGRLLNDAMPRHAIDAIEAQIQGLAQRVVEGRQAGFDSGALARIEDGLSEVRDALRGLTPAENLVGYHEAVAGLAEKIDLIVAQRDPAAMQQLQSSITTLREMASHVASNETVNRLAADVQQLAENVEYIAKTSAGGDALYSIEHRLAALSEALAERAQKDGGISPRLEAMIESLLGKVEQLQKQPAMAHELQHAVTTMLDMADRAVSNETVHQLTAEVHQLVANVEHIVRNGATGEALFNIEHRLAALSELLEHAQGAAQWPQLEMLLQSLHEKVEQLQQAPGDQAAFSQLDSNMVQLAEKLDAIGSRFAQLDAIEHGIGDLLMQVEEMRTARDNPQASADAFEHDIARTQDALEAMHETLGHVVDRLAMIEQDIHEGKRAVVPAYGGMAASHQTIGNLAVSVASDMAPLVPVSAPTVAPPASIAAPAADAAPPQTASEEPEEEPDLSPDRPLEPGSGQPNSPAARVAASEADLGSARPTPASDPNSKSNFIAAARRAAQAASQEQNSRSTRGQSGGSDATDELSLGSRLMHRVKTLFIAASVIAIVIGSVQTASKFHMFGFGNSNAPADKVAKSTDSGLEQSADDQHADDPLATGSTKPAADQTAPGHADAAPTILPPKATATPSAGLILPGTSSGLPSLLSAPGASSVFDITGSIPHAKKSAKTSPAVTSTPAVGELPTAIGGDHLRSAAIAGDAAAAYEVGLRYVEGKGVPVNFEQAALWFKRAADKGLVPAQFRLASLLEKGKGVPKDIDRARALYLAAANKGNAKAMHNLAVIYAEGIDGKSDYASAIKWFRMASKRGLADSQFNLGVLAARGIGMNPDLSEAYKWFALAAKQGDKEAAKKRDEIAEQFDAAQLAAAKHAVDTFVPKPQPAEAVNVPAPAGGWDSAASQPATKARQSKTYKVSKH